MPASHLQYHFMRCVARQRCGRFFKMFGSRQRRGHLRMVVTSPHVQLSSCKPMHSVGAKDNKTTLCPIRYRPPRWS